MRQLLLSILASACWVVVGFCDSADLIGQSIATQTRSEDEVGCVDLVCLDQKIKSWLPSVAEKVVSLEGGSGVIVTSDGWVMTAGHVSGTPGRKITVRLANGILWPAQTYGVNWQTDIGLVRLLGDRKWPSLKSAQPIEVKPGQWCVAFGYPWDDATATSPAVRIGRVSSVDAARIVSDVPIIGGDSGGPVLNLDGEVIGINSRIRMDVQHNIHVSVGQFSKDWQQLISGAQIGLNASLHSIGDDDKVGRFSRNSSPVQAAMSDLWKPNVSSVVRIECGSLADSDRADPDIVLGTIVSPSGLVISKLSEIVPEYVLAATAADGDKKVKCMVGEATVWAKLLAQDQQLDLVLLQLDSTAQIEFVPAKIADEDNRHTSGVAGQVCVSMVAGKDSKWLGSLGTIMVPIQDFQKIVDRQGFDFGATFGVNSGLFVRGIFPESLAQLAGVKTGDRIQQVAGQSVATEADMRRELGRAASGELVPLTVNRSGRQVELSFENPARKPIVWDRWGGGPFSKRRFGFGDVIAHDTSVSPTDCGGPLLDLQGNVIGINISRSMRNTTFAIPIETVIKFVHEYRRDVKIGR